MENLIIEETSVVPAGEKSSKKVIDLAQMRTGGQRTEVRGRRSEDGRSEDGRSEDGRSEDGKSEDGFRST